MRGERGREKLLRLEGLGAAEAKRRLAAWTQGSG
jgi:hypothetical protein